MGLKSEIWRRIAASALPNIAIPSSEGKASTVASERTGEILYTYIRSLLYMEYTEHIHCTHCTSVDIISYIVQICTVPDFLHTVSTLKKHVIHHHRNQLGYSSVSQLYLIYTPLSPKTQYFIYFICAVKIWAESAVRNYGKVHHDRKHDTIGGVTVTILERFQFLLKNHHTHRKNSFFWPSKVSVQVLCYSIIGTFVLVWPALYSNTVFHCAKQVVPSENRHGQCAVCDTFSSLSTPWVQTRPLPSFPFSPPAAIVLKLQHHGQYRTTAAYCCTALLCNLWRFIFSFSLSDANGLSFFESNRSDKPPLCNSFFFYSRYCFVRSVVVSVSPIWKKVNS